MLEASILGHRPNIFWIGGGSGAGKSTIAKRLAGRYGGMVYSTDAAMTAHAARCSAEDCPRLQEFKHMTMDERWVERSAEVMLETFHWFNGEGFAFILEDLVNIQGDAPIFVEGFRLLPHLVKPHLYQLNRGIWLIPTPEFRRMAFETRGSLWKIPNRTSQPDIALRNHLKREQLFSDRLSSEITALGLRKINIDSCTEDDLLNKVAFYLGKAQI